ncbi:MAG: MarR family transcriptional regulator [Blastomonas sp.]
MTDSIGYLLNDAARLFRRAFDANTRDLGVTGLQWRIIARLNHQPGLRQSQLADYLEVEPITLSRMIDRLADAELVERRPDPGDRRAWQIYLTKKAEPLKNEMYRRADIIIKEALQGLSEEEKTVLNTLVDRVRANLSRKQSCND